MPQVTLPTEPNKRLTALTRSQVHRRPESHSPTSIDTRSQTLTAETQVSTALELVAKFLLATTGAHGVAVAVVDETGLYCRASAGEAPRAGTSIRMQNSLCGRCIDTAATFYCEDTVAKCPNALPARSILLQPIILGRHPRGLVALFSRQPQAFPPASLAIARSAAELMAIALSTWSPQLDCVIDDQMLDVDISEPARPGSASAPTSPTPVTPATTDEPRVGKILYGLPCTKCGAYFDWGAKVCPICKTQR